MSDILKLILIFFFFFSFLLKLSATVIIDQWPTDLYLECENGGFDNQDVLDWIDDYLATATATTDCVTGSSITWSHSFTSIPNNIICIEDLVIDFYVTDECGDMDFAVAFVYLEDTTPPVLDPPSISTHNLYCDGAGNIVGLQELHDANYYFAPPTDNCASSPNFSIYPDFPLYMLNANDCGQSFDFVVDAEDGCANFSDFYTITINLINIQIEFNSTSHTISEDGGTQQVCLTITEPADESITVRVDKVVSSSTASNGADYQAIPNFQNLVFPANSTADVCFDIVVNEDALAEADETVTFEIGNITGPFYAVEGNDSDYTLTIIDNDDDDDDGIANLTDNCPTDYNPFQEDFDNDGEGDACDQNTTISNIAEFQDYIYVNRLYSGIVLKATNGSCWVVVVQNDGTLQTVSVACP